MIYLVAFVLQTRTTCSVVSKVVPAVRTPTCAAVDVSGSHRKHQGFSLVQASIEVLYAKTVCAYVLVCPPHVIVFSALFTG